MSKTEPPISITLDSNYSTKLRKLRGDYQKSTEFIRELLDNEEKRRKSQ